MNWIALQHPPLNHSTSTNTVQSVSTSWLSQFSSQEPFLKQTANTDSVLTAAKTCSGKTRSLPSTPVLSLESAHIAELQVE